MASGLVRPSGEAEARRPQKVPEEAGVPEVDERWGRGLQAEAPIQELHHLHLCHRAP